jgi:ferredoxin
MSFCSELKIGKRYGGKMSGKFFKVTIDREECISCGACWTTCPEVFEENEEDGFSQIVEAYQLSGNIAEGQVPETLGKCVQDAANGCPVEIIHVEEQ